MNLDLDVLPRRFILLIAPSRLARGLMTDIVARLALRGPLTVMDGGNSLDAYGLARLVRRQTHDLANVLNRIRLARAFTCYQMSALLAQTQADASPKVILDLLSTFYDDSAPLYESLRLLRQGIRHLKRLNRLAPVAVSAHPPGAAQPERLLLLDELRDAAEHVVVFEHPQPPPPAPLLW